LDYGGEIFFGELGRQTKMRNQYEKEANVLVLRKINEW
jgi:hypothetical protein